MECYEWKEIQKETQGKWLPQPAAFVLLVMGDWLRMTHVFCPTTVRFNIETGRSFSVMILCQGTCYSLKIDAIFFVESKVSLGSYCATTEDASFLYIFFFCCGVGVYNLCDRVYMFLLNFSLIFIVCKKMKRICWKLGILNLVKDVGKC